MPMPTHNRRGERGVSLLLVVAGMFAILAMTALAIDVVTLYSANSDAQKAADAAALAGAKIFVSSSSTSDGTVTPSDVCTTGAGTGPMANAAANAAAQANTISGVAATLNNVTCGGTVQNPQITVNVGRTNLPLFFARIFGTQTATVSATAKAEAYNNSSAANTTWVQTGSVKPWLVENCTPGVTGGGCVGSNYFFAASTNALPSPATYIGNTLRLVPYGQSLTGPPAGVTYYIGSPPTGAPPVGDQPNVCPSTVANPACSSADGNPDYFSDIACANQHQVTCGDQYVADPLNLSYTVAAPETQGAVQCLTHSSATGLGNGQDIFSSGSAPVTITKGSSNPNTSIPANSTIARSDSVVTVPVFNYTIDPCGGGTCTSTIPMQVVGFLQLGIQQVEGTGGTNVAGAVDAVVLNAVGCNPGGAGTPISGGGVSPIPVRLIQ